MLFSSSKAESDKFIDRNPDLSNSMPELFKPYYTSVQQWGRESSLAGCTGFTIGVLLCIKPAEHKN